MATIWLERDEAFDWEAARARTQGPYFDAKGPIPPAGRVTREAIAREFDVKFEFAGPTPRVPYPEEVEDAMSVLIQHMAAGPDNDTAERLEKLLARGRKTR